MVHGLKTLLSRLSFLLIFLISFSLSAKTLKVDTVTPSVTNGDFTITPNGTGDIVLGTFSGVLKSSTGVVSVGNVNLTSEVTGTLPEANGGTGVTDMATILVEILGTQTISGAKTFSSDILMSGTGQIDIPVGTTAQRSGSPNTGMIRYNSTTSSYEGYAGTDWASLGDGGGGSLLNLIIDPSFETGVTEGTCTTCTASSEATIVELTDLNTKSLKMAFSASVGDYTDTTTTSSQYTGVVGKASARCKTDQEGIEFCSMVDGAESACVAVSSGDIWDTYAVNSTMSSTSFGYKIVARNSITGNVYCDEIFAGSNPIETVVTQGQSEVYILPSVTADFWDATGLETNFDVSLIPLTGSTLIEWNDSTNTELVAKERVKISVVIQTYSAAAASTSILDSAGNTLIFDQAGDTATYLSPSIDIVLEKGDHIYFSSSNGSSRFGGMTITATPEQNKAVMVSVDDDSMTDPVAYTPTSQGFGTIGSIELRWHKDGKYLVIDGSFDIGTSTAVEGQIALPNSVVIDSDITSTQNAGTYFTDVSTSSNGGAVLMTGGDSFINFSTVSVFAASTTVALSPANGNVVGATGTKVSINARVPIVGWSATPTAVIAVPVEENNPESVAYTGYTSGTTAGIKFKTVQDDTSNVLLAHDNTGAFTKISALKEVYATVSCAYDSVGVGYMTIQHRNAAGTILKGTYIDATGTPAFYGNNNSLTARLDVGDYFQCNSQAAVYDNTTTHISVIAHPAKIKVFLGNVNPTEFIKTPSAVKPVVFSALVTPTNGSTCTISNQIGDIMTSTTPVATGECTVNFTGLTGTPNCQVTASNYAGAITEGFYTRINTLSSSAIKFMIGYGSSGGAAIVGTGVGVRMNCHGVQ